MSTKNSDRNSETSNFEADRSAYTDKKYNLIPLSPKLIEHVRRLDSLNVSIIPISITIYNKHIYKMEIVFLFPIMSSNFDELC